MAKTAFWGRHEPSELALEVKEKYRERMFLVHPDHGGNAEEAKVVNLAYERIKRILRKKGVEV